MKTHAERDPADGEFSDPPEVSVMTTLLGLPAEDAHMWALLMKAAELEGTKQGKAIANHLYRTMTASSLVPLDGRVDLPPHVIGRVSLKGNQVSMIHSFDLENLRQFPGAFALMLSRRDPDLPSLLNFLVLLERQTDWTYLRRILATRAPDRVEYLLRMALERQPDHGPTHHLLMEMLESQGRLEESMEEGRRFTEMSSTPGDVEAGILDLAEVLTLQNRHDQAIAEIEASKRRRVTPEFLNAAKDLRDTQEARVLRSPADASVITDDLMEFLIVLADEAETFLPGANQDALKEYASLPEWTMVEKAGLDDRPMKDTLSFLLYFAFAHSSPSFPDYPADFISAADYHVYASARLVDLAIHRSRFGQFEFMGARGEGKERRLMEVRDVLTREVLKVSFAPSNREPAYPLAKAGSLFRALLVPWGDLWFVRGPLTSPIDGSTRQSTGPHLWYADLVATGGGAWTAYVMDGDSTMIVGTAVSAFCAPGAVVRALQMAYRITSSLPDLLVTPEGFPFVDESGRTSSSWRERPVIPLDQAMNGSSVDRAGGRPLQPWLQPVSLLKPWVETFGIRHVSDTEEVKSTTIEFRTMTEAVFSAPPKSRRATK